MKISPITLILGAAIGLYVLNKPSTKTIYFGGKGTETKKESKFPGYEIKDQHLIITDAAKAKKFVFETGKKEPEGALFKLVFGADSVTYTDVKKLDNYYGSTNFVVKDKDEQDAVYILLSYLFAGAYKQSPHRAAHYADIINNFTVFLKKMFNVDYPIIKSVDEAKSFFEGLEKTV